MPLLTLRRVLDRKAACSCCGQDDDLTVEATDNSTRSIAVFCFGCFGYLQEVTLVRSNRALT